MSTDSTDNVISPSGLSDLSFEGSFKREISDKEIAAVVAKVKREGKLKRKPPRAIDTIAERLAKRNRLLTYGVLNIPLLNAKAYKKAKKNRKLYVGAPNNHSMWDWVLEHDLQDTIIFGSDDESRFLTFEIEGVLLDGATSVLWQLPKVTKDFKLLDYHSTHQPHTEEFGDVDDTMVSPRTVSKTPTALEQMFGTNTQRDSAASKVAPSPEAGEIDDVNAELQAALEDISSTPAPVKRLLSDESPTITARPRTRAFVKKLGLSLCE